MTSSETIHHCYRYIFYSTWIIFIVIINVANGTCNNRKISIKNKNVNKKEQQNHDKDHIVTIKNKRTAPSWSSSTFVHDPDPQAKSGGVDFDDKDFPDVVFAPSGRLRGVERAALESTDPELCLGGASVLCIHFGYGIGSTTTRENDKNGNQSYSCDDSSGQLEQEGVIVLARRGISPHVHYDTDFTTIDSKIKPDKQENENKDSLTNNHITNTSTRSRRVFLPSLLLPDQYTPPTTTVTHPSLPLYPISLPFSSLLLASAGNPIDSSILLGKMEEMSISLFTNDNGALTLRSSIESSQQQPYTPLLKCDSLARRLADAMQDSTQNMAGKMGRILRAGAIIVGCGSNTRSRSSTNMKQEEDASTVHIWRLDPTGQFWLCHACAIGYNAGMIEGYLLTHFQNKVYKETMEDDAEEEDYESDNYHHNHISTLDVEEYLSSLNYNDALKLACQCLLHANPFLLPKTSHPSIEDNYVQNNNPTMQSSSLSSIEHPTIIMDRHGITAVLMRKVNGIVQSEIIPTDELLKILTSI